jgi:CBS domain-containing protein
MKIEEVMTRNVLTLDPGATLADAARLMWERDCGFLPVVEPQSQALLGVVTDRDACMAAYTQGATLCCLPVAQAMAKKVMTCKPDDDLARAHELCRRHQLHRLPVTDAQGRLVGIVSVNDLARAATRLRGNGRQQMCADVGETIAAVGRPRELAATG